MSSSNQMHCSLFIIHLRITWIWLLYGHVKLSFSYNSFVKRFLYYTITLFITKSIPVDPKHLRNEFNFWNVHGIMNTLGLLQSK